jgi:hypothetical protein
LRAKLAGLDGLRARLVREREQIERALGGVFMSTTDMTIIAVARSRARERLAIISRQLSDTVALKDTGRGC